MKNPILDEEMSHPVTCASDGSTANASFPAFMEERLGKGGLLPQPADFVAMLKSPALPGALFCYIKKTSSSW
ncbi:hypothetical protein CLOSTMETH_03832 [[Clostridium] methylpentosum DSM 5476]|uniref:Uncharacterized protein n=1 Tax=[Clostridium] methylpentosum DSM 5476 TaxID=537013 RepID=C0EIY6_9FIRM|nr:hypothetical protein CLOSTMETH_03832 [[Clostridium] methylpentosum DSM 5476]